MHVLVMKASPMLGRGRSVIVTAEIHYGE